MSDPKEKVFSVIPSETMCIGHQWTSLQTVYLYASEKDLILLALEALARAQSCNTDRALDLFKYLKTGVRG